VGTEWLSDEEATEALGAQLAAHTPPGGVWLLTGDLGAGKTTWVRGFVHGLGGSGEDVSSPTYAVQHRYDTPVGRVVHVDLYRLGGTGAWSLGLEEVLGVEDRLVVEWPGLDGPWSDRWVAQLELLQEGTGRRATWTLPAFDVLDPSVT